MSSQLGLFSPNGINLRWKSSNKNVNLKEVFLRRRDEKNPRKVSSGQKPTMLAGTLLKPGKNNEEESSIVKSRWSRLDYFVHKPTKLEELTDVARMLLIAKREEEMKAALRVPSKTPDVE